MLFCGEPGEGLLYGDRGIDNLGGASLVASGRPVHHGVEPIGLLFGLLERGVNDGGHGGGRLFDSGTRTLCGFRGGLHGCLEVRIGSRDRYV